MAETPTAARTGSYDGREVCTVMQAARRAGVSRRTIYNWLHAGKLQWVKTASGTLRIFVDTLWQERPDASRTARPITWPGYKRPTPKDQP